jgi:hypothetical protein
MFRSDLTTVATAPFFCVGAEAQFRLKNLGSQFEAAAVQIVLLHWNYLTPHEKPGADPLVGACFPATRAHYR